MPPQAVEQGNNLENTPQVPTPPERFLEIERGDVFVQDNNGQQSQTNTTSTSQTSTPPKQRPVDPVQIVKGLFSAGFTPTKAQIQSLQSNVQGPGNLTDAWFKIFLQRVIKQSKKKQKKN